MKYLWIDANIILRFITGSPPEMAEKTLELMKRVEKGEVCLRVSSLVLAEVVWVLSSFYKFSKHEIANSLIPFINADGIATENPTLLVQALQVMADKDIDFVDAYLASLARFHDEIICSFDDDFKKLDVKLITPPGK
ncbi:twitching motility protein PilT [Carboxydothermus islandicus]|uniref:Twitching motility protein PilT n=1 Tax=Carboxydothermus islandicus TaxID=661089 RepID=A0A1L8D018_9THEO|nr:PIN domain-containing protein [Carboxydothermus islandicus]GAV24461.1 twitching motility protein PilT [Carboxydothermus islandicus]